jgi:hypothetical protein
MLWFREKYFRQKIGSLKMVPLYEKYWLYVTLFLKDKMPIFAENT